MKVWVNIEAPTPGVCCKYQLIHPKKKREYNHVLSVATSPTTNSDQEQHSIKNINFTGGNDGTTLGFFNVK